MAQTVRKIETQNPGITLTKNRTGLEYAGYGPFTGPRRGFGFWSELDYLLA